MKLTLLKKIQEAKGTKTFVFDTDKKFKWLPGQYIYVTLPRLKYPDPRGTTRHFTISSSPTERIAGITTRIRETSGFKKTLDELPIGSIFEGEGPNGTFILDEHEKGEHVLIAGGIGITPFRSFIKYNIDKNLAEITLHLIYSNSIPEEITFKSELKMWAQKYDNIHLDMTITKPEETKEKWSEHTGRIDATLVSAISKNYNNPTFWLCGPPPMVDALEKVLGELKIPSGKVIAEKFTGY